MAFCGYLKQSTAVTIQLGPFVDEDDGKTGEEGLTIEDTDIYLSKNGGAQANPNDTNNAAHDDNAYYTKQLDATDTGTLGLLTVVVHESGALPVRQDYLVVVAHWYDTMCSTDLLHVDVHAIDDDDAAADNLETACDNYSATRGLAGTALPAAAADAAGGLPISDAGGLDLDTQLGTDIDAILTDTAQIGAAGAGLTAVPWNAAWDAEVQSECADALTAYDPPTKTEMDTAHALLATVAKQDVIDGIVDAILVDTNELQTDWHDGGRLDLLLDAISTANIADAVWDEALADHNTEDTIGNVLNDLTEESGGTYRFTAAAVQSTLGAGATDVVLTVTCNAVAVEGVTVWVTTTNDPDDAVVASGTTNSSGQVTFYLDAGTFYVWKQKDGYTFTNPETKTVS